MRSKLLALFTTVAVLFGITACAPAAPNKVGDAVEVPDTAAGRQVEWVLGALNDAEPVTERDITGRFTPDFLAQASAADLLGIFEQMREGAPWTLTSAEGTETQFLGMLESEAADTMELQLALDDSELIAGLLFGPPTPERVPATSWDELEETIGGLDADTSLAVTRVSDGERIFEAGEQTQKPLGSIFKLYVLGAVADAVAAGTLTWEQELTLTDDVRSLPSGELQNEPTGTIVTVQEAAAAMISISDNTATDLLIATVGREAVEQALTDYGHSDPGANTPLPMTRDLFTLGWGDDGGYREQWADADEAERRDILESLPGGAPAVEAADVVDAVWQYGIDWFATADDLVALHVRLQDAAATEAGAPVREILAANPGGEFPDWEYVGFKGGSSVGVLATSWYLEDAEGEGYVISMQSSSEDPAAQANQGLYIGVGIDVAAILAEE